MDHEGPMDWGGQEPPYGGGGGDGLGEPIDHDGEQPGDPIDHDGEQPGDPQEGEPDPDDREVAEHTLDDHAFGGPDTGDGINLEFADLSDDYGHDAGPGPDEIGAGPDDHTGHDAADSDEAPAALNDPAAEPVVGADPDLDPVGDDPQWIDTDPFPPQLDIGEPPEPVDGFPWSDPAVLGEAHDTGDYTFTPEAGSPPPSDLLDYDAHDLPAGADPWQALAASEDPATSSLARWWAPDT
jgi:hypothetical protein